MMLEPCKHVVASCGCFVGGRSPFFVWVRAKRPYQPYQPYQPFQPLSPIGVSLHLSYTHMHFCCFHLWQSLLRCPGSATQHVVGVHRTQVPCIHTSYIPGHSNTRGISSGIFVFLLVFLILFLSLLLFKH